MTPWSLELRAHCFLRKLSRLFNYSSSLPTHADYRAGAHIVPNLPSLRMAQAEVGVTGVVCGVVSTSARQTGSEQVAIPW